MNEIYDEADFVSYAFQQMGIKILNRMGGLFDLENGFQVEVERRDLYKLSAEGWVISPFDNIGKLCEFINKSVPEKDE